MWIVFSVLCMVLLTSADIVGKKAVDKDGLAPLKLRIAVMAVSVVTALIAYCFGLGESGLAPWTLLLKYPLILVAVFCTVFTDFFYLYCLKYIGMTIMEVISGFEGIFIFAGLFFINLFTGELTAVKDMLVPVRFILICIIIVFTFLLPNIETIKLCKQNVSSERQKEKHNVIIGITIAFLAVIASSCESLINDVILGTGSIGTVDYIMTAYFAFVVPLIVFTGIWFVKKKNTKSSYKLINRHSVIYVVLGILYMFFGMLATSFDAVRTEIMYLTYPVISILGARIVLKEKYSLKQNVCIWIITISAMAFCVIDYIV